jgi:hypothetical protein
MPKCTPRLTYMEHTTWSTFEKVMNGKWHSKLVIAILNMLWCPLALPMHLLFFDIWWIMSSVNIWMILHWWRPHFLENMTNHVSLYAKLEKCRFHQFEVEFLGYIIFVDGVDIDCRKVQTIVDRATLSPIRDVQCFLGFANFYWWFIAHYSTIMTLLIHLTHKDQFFC